MPLQSISFLSLASLFPPLPSLFPVKCFFISLQPCSDTYFSYPALLQHLSIPSPSLLQPCPAPHMLLSSPSPALLLPLIGPSPASLQPFLQPCINPFLVTIQLFPILISFLPPPPPRQHGLLTHRCLSSWDSSSDVAFYSTVNSGVHSRADADQRIIANNKFGSFMYTTCTKTFYRSYTI